MRKSRTTLILLCLAFVAGIAQTATAQMTFTTPRDIRVLVRFKDIIDTVSQREGDTIFWEVVEDAYYNGALVVPKGANAYGYIADIQPPGGASKFATMRILPIDVEVGGSRVPLWIHPVPEAPRDNFVALGAMGLVHGAFARGDDHIVIDKDTVTLLSIPPNTALTAVRGEMPLDMRFRSSFEGTSRVYIFPRDQRITLRFRNTIDTLSLKEGDVVWLETTEDVYVNGSLFIPKGSPAAAVVTEVSGPLGSNRNANMRLKLQSVKAHDGTMVPLNYWITATPGEMRRGWISLGQMGMVNGAFVRGDRHLVIDRDTMVDASIGTGTRVTLIGPMTTPSGSWVTLRFTQPVSTETAKSGDVVYFETVEDVYANGKLLIPRGSRATGMITDVRPPRSAGRNAQLRISFQTVTTPEGRTYPLHAARTLETESINPAAPAASVAGGVILGPIGLVTGAFIKGEHITIDRGSTVRAFIPMEAITMVPIGTIITRNGTTFREVIVPTNTRINLELLEPVSTRTSMEGDIVDFMVRDDVYVNDTLIIVRGAPATGIITNVKGPRMFGGSGKLEMQFTSVLGVDGSLIPLQPWVAEHGTEGIGGEAVAASAAGGLVLGPIGLVAGAFVKGKHVEIPAGGTAVASIAADQLVRGYPTTVIALVP